MRIRFRPGTRLVSVPVRVWGPRRPPSDLVFVLDTGTDRTIIDTQIALRLGFSERDAIRRSRVSSPLGHEEGFMVVAPRFRALGWERGGFELACHQLTTTTEVDGLLGADFFDGLRLVIDYGDGTVELSESGVTVKPG